MSKEGVLSVNTSGGAVIETLSSEGGPPTPPAGHNFNFSGSIAGGSAANGAIEFITPGGPGAATDGQMDAVVRTDGVTIHINASNNLEVIGGLFSEEFTVDAHTAPGTNPVVPDGGGNVNITGAQVAAGVIGTNVIRTDSLAANTYTIEVQRSQAAAASTVADNGVSHFNSAMFTVDGNGFVSLAGGGLAIDSIGVQTGTNPIVPTAGGLVTINGATVAAGTNPVRTDGTGANTMAVEVQRSQAIAATDATKIGLAAFDSSKFSVDANGFVTTSGTAILDTLTGNTGGAISPVAGNINTVGSGSITIAGAGNTLTTQLTGLTNHAVLVGAGTDTITKIAATANTGAVLQNNSGADPSYSTATYPSTTTVSQLLYSSATNTVSGLATANRAVLTTGTTGVPVMTALAADGQLIIGSTAGAPAAATLTAGTGISITNASNAITIAVNGSAVGETITGDTGGALSPSAGNWNIISNVSGNNSGSSVSFSGSGSTLTMNVTKSTNTIVGLGAGNATLSGTDNVGLGSSVLSGLTSGAFNTAMGFNAAQHITSGQSNVAIGDAALQALTTSNNNVAIGDGSLIQLVSGTANTAVGQGSGNAYTGSESSNICIKNTGTLGESNAIHIGTQGSGSGQQNTCFVAGIVGVTVANPQLVTINSSTGQLGVTTSDIFLWNVVTTNQTGTTNNGYVFVSAGGALTISLPTTSAVGDMFRVVLDGATSWQITQAAGQQIRLASSTTTLGATGSLTSTAQGNAVTLVCRVANTIWTAVSSIGNITVA